MRLNKETANKYCFFCNDYLSKAKRSKEHIILNVIGGERKVLDFTCRKCNNDQGGDWEETVANKFAVTNNLIGIQKERGPVAPTLVTCNDGSEVVLHTDHITMAKSEYEKKITKDGAINLQIKGSSEKEVRALLERFKKEHPELNVNTDELYAKSTHVVVPCPTETNNQISFGDPNIIKSAVKSCVALGFYHKVNGEYFRQAKEFIQELENSCQWFHYYDEDIVANRVQNNELFHCVSIFGSPITKNILGYVEYYGFYRVLIFISDSHEGEEFHHTYSIDPVAGKELSLTINFNIFDKKIKEKLMNDNEEIYCKENFKIAISKFKTRCDFLSNVNHASYLLSDEENPDLITEKSIKKLARLLAAVLLEVIKQLSGSVKAELARASYFVSFRNRSAGFSIWHLKHKWQLLVSNHAR